MNPTGTNYYLWPATIERRKATRLKKKPWWMLFLLLAGCASVFDAPVQVEPLTRIQPVQYRHPNDKTPVICRYVYDRVIYEMMVPRNECKGWTPV